MAQTIVVADDRAEIEFACGSCQKPISLTHLEQKELKICPRCDNTELYQHKDFNKKVGFVIFLAGAALAPWTYYISLFVALLIDAALYPFFPWMSVCYRCKSELRGWPKNPKLDRFNHERAAHYEYKDKWPFSPNSIENKSKPSSITTSIWTEKNFHLHPFWWERWTRITNFASQKTVFII